MKPDLTPPEATRCRRPPLALTLALLAALSLPGLASAAPEKASGGIRFTYTDASAASVNWAGAFNSWSATANAMTKGEGGVWSIVLALPPGEHQYKFVVNGQWVADPENGATAGDFGNSAVVVGPNGDLVVQKAASNTSLSPKILVGGRAIGLYQSVYSGRFDRMELTRPTLDLDLGFDVRISDALQAKVLMNINPQNEDVQDYRSRLNYKRGSMELKRPGFNLKAYDSEPIGIWDDPLHLVGDIGPFHHPWGFERQGVQLTTRQRGFDVEAQFSDNFNQDETNSDRYLSYRIDNFPTFQIPEGTSPRFVFETDPIATGLSLIQTGPSGGGFVMRPNQATKLQTLDFGDNGRLFGFGDNFEDVFAARIRRPLGERLSVGLLGRSDRGFGLGRLVLTEPAGDSSVRVVNALFEQQWFGGGLEARWQPRDNVRLWAELLGGVRRANFVNGSSELLMPVDSILSTGIRADRASAVSRNLDGTHRSLDESVRWIAGGSWSFAQGDIALRAEVERETHEYPAWTQEPVIPAGLSPDDHARFETVEFQRAAYVRTNENLENSLTTWRLGWDRNWRYYLNREVKTSLDVEFLTFDYDARTAWEHQLWFPTGNFWLEHGGYRVGVERLTVLGSEDVVSVRPRIEVPLWRERNVKFAWRGDFEGVELDLRPRFAESVFQLGFDLTRTVRIQSDTRWAKYDAPVLRLDGGFVSQFTEAILKLAPGVEVSLGMGIDPWVLDPNTNEYAYIGRDVFLNNRYVSGFYAETNYLSGAPVIRAAEQALQDERRVQLEAIIRF